MRDDTIGNRVDTLKTIGNNLNNFSNAEKISGPLFPLFAMMIHLFDDAFEQNTIDLKNEAESIS